MRKMRGTAEVPSGSSWSGTLDLLASRTISDRSHDFTIFLVFRDRMTSVSFSSGAFVRTVSENTISELAINKLRITSAQKRYHQTAWP